MLRNITKPAHFKKLLLFFVASITLLLISAIFQGGSSIPKTLKIDGWKRKYVDRCCPDPNIPGGGLCTTDLKHVTVYTLFSYVRYGDCESADIVYYIPRDFLALGVVGTFVSGGLIVLPTVRTYWYYKKRI